MKLIKKTIEYGLYLLVFLLPWQTRLILRAGEINGGYFEYGTISLYAVDLLLVFLMIVFGWQKIVEIKKRPEEIKIQRVWYILTGLEIFIVISIFFSVDKWLAVYGYLRFLLGVGIFWLLTSVNYNKMKLYYSFIAGAFVQVGFAIWQFIFQTSFANKWLGLAMHDPEVLGTSVIETVSGTRWLRAYGSLDHPNLLGGYLCFGFLLLIILRLKNREEDFELKIKNYKPCLPAGRLRINKFIFIFLYYFILGIIFSALFFSFSRTAWLSLFFGLVIIFIILIYQKKYLAQKIFLKSVLFLGIVFFLSFNQYSQLVMTRLSDKTRLEQKSNVERLESFEIAGSIIKKNFLFGTGIGNYGLAVKDEVISDQPSWYYQPVHNFYLLVFSEIGFFGGLCIVLIFLEIIFPAYKQRGEKSIVYVSLLFVLAGLGMFDHWLWSLHFGVLFFWLILGIVFKEIIDRGVKE